METIGDLLVLSVIGVTVYIIWRCLCAKRPKIENLINRNEGNIVMLGLPKAGKTVYFSVSMRLLQNLFNVRNDKSSIIFNTALTDNMVTSVLENLKFKGANGWPPSTVAREVHNVSITYNDKHKNLYFKDYAGETFMSAFSSPVILKDVKSKKMQLEPDVKELICGLEFNQGIMLIIDSTFLFGCPDQTLSNCLFNILLNIEQAKFTGKLALIITKCDMIKNIKEISVEDLFRTKQPNSFARLKNMKCEHKFFTVAAVECIIDDNGEYVPPKNYTPENNSSNVCAPFEWMLSMDLNSSLKE